MKFSRIITFTFAALISLSVFSCEKPEKEKGNGIDSKIDALINDHFTALQNGNYDVYSSLYPDFYIEMYDKFAVSYGYANAQSYFIETEYGYYVTAIGEDFEIKATVNTIENMSGDELNTGETAIKQTYGKEVDLTSGYIIEITEEASGKNNTEKETYEMMVLEIGDKLYVYNQYFEYMATMQ